MTRTTNDAEQHPDPYGVGAKRPSEYKLGERVRYYPVLGHPDDKAKFEDTTIRSEPWQLGDGSWVIKVEGRAGGVHTPHVGSLPTAATETGRTATEIVTGMLLDEVARVIVSAGYTMSEVHDAMVNEAMRVTHHNQTHAAAKLGLSRDQLRYRMTRGSKAKPEAAPE